MDHLETAIPRVPSHNQPPNVNTIAYTSKICLKIPRYSCLLWGYARAWQTQKWMLTVSYWMEQRAPNGGARESTQGDKGVCNPIGGTTIWTNQYPPELMSLAAYVSEDGLVSHHWDKRSLVLQTLYASVQGNARSKKWVGECVGDFWDSIGNVNEINT